MSEQDPAAQEERLYTLEEAEAALPELRETVLKMQEARRIVVRSGRRVRGAVAGNGGGTEGREYLDAVATLKAGVEDLTQRGIIVRDVESGLIDFPSEREGSLVYLCWRLDEDRIGYWHPPETGLPGRRPL